MNLHEREAIDVPPVCIYFIDAIHSAYSAIIGIYSKVTSRWGAIFKGLNEMRKVLTLEGQET